MYVYALCALVLLYAVSAQEEEAWSRKEFPSPLTNLDQCGRAGQLSYICDPSNILKAEEARQLEDALWRIRNETTCPCASFFCTGGNNGYKVGIAIVRKIKPDTSVRTSENEDDISFILDQNLHEASLFAYTLLQRWQMGQCGEDIVIVYSVVDNVFYTNVGSVAGKLLTKSRIGNIAMNTRRLFRPTSTFEGLNELLKQYKAVLMGEYREPEYMLRVPVPQAVVGGGANMAALPTLAALILSVMAAALL